MPESSSLFEVARQIELLILDVDGVLTDGRVTYTSSGDEIKSFHVRDGSAIKCWQESGRKIAIISGRRSDAVSNRAAELGITRVEQGASEKLPVLRKILDDFGVPAEHVAVMGDDLPDWPLFQTCGLGIAVADACDELKAAAGFVTRLAGGHGAVREAITWLMTAQGTWQDVIERHRVAKE